MQDEIRSDDGNEVNQISTEKHSWVAEIKDELSKRESIPLKEHSEKRKNTISRLPATIYENFDHDWEPRKVTFGPYHHGRYSCKETQQIKKRVVLHSLERCKKTIDDYIQCLNPHVRTLKDAYDDLHSYWEQDSYFLQLMIYDGCFFLEILHAANENIWDNPVWDIDGRNPNKLMEDYRHDMLSPENQLPLLVLEKLFDVRETNEPNGSILEKIQKLDAQEYVKGHILKFVSPRVNLKIPTKKCLHVLDLYRHSLLSQELKGESKIQCLWPILDSTVLKFICILPILIFSFLLLPFLRVTLLLVTGILFLFKMLTYIFETQPTTEFPFNIPSASNLYQVGIGFTSRTKSLRDTSYGRRTLRLPHISVDGTTRSIFLNVLIFEQLHEDAKYEVTSYIYFMSNLIKDVENVHHQQRCDVIDTSLTAEQIVELFHGLTRGINVDNPESFIVPRYRSVSERLTNSFKKMNEPWRKDLCKLISKVHGLLFLY